MTNSIFLRRFWCQIGVSLALLCSFQVQAFEAPDELVKRISTEVLQILKQQKNPGVDKSAETIQLVEKVVLPHFNFRRMTMLVVGREWRNATAEQQQALTDAFYALLVKTYSNALMQYSDQTIVYKPLRMAQGDKIVRVNSEIQQSGAAPIQLDYTLRLEKEGWKVFDIVVGGVSLVTNYRGSFNKELQQKGIDGLIALLQEKTRQQAQP